MLFIAWEMEVPQFLWYLYSTYIDQRIMFILFRYFSNLFDLYVYLIVFRESILVNFFPLKILLKVMIKSLFLSCCCSVSGHRCLLLQPNCYIQNWLCLSWGQILLHLVHLGIFFIKLDVFGMKYLLN